MTSARGNEDKKGIGEKEEIMTPLGGNKIRA
jgi:hypothetical protein